MNKNLTLTDVLRINQFCKTYIIIVNLHKTLFLPAVSVKEGDRAVPQQLYLLGGLHLSRNMSDGEKLRGRELVGGQRGDISLWVGQEQLQGFLVSHFIIMSYRKDTILIHCTCNNCKPQKNCSY